MKGIIKLELNEATIKAAIQDYLTNVFDASQLALVIDVTPDSTNGGECGWRYIVTIDATPEEVAREAGN